MLQIGVTLIFCLIMMVAMPIMAVIMYPAYKKYGDKDLSLKEFVMDVINF